MRGPSTAGTRLAATTALASIIDMIGAPPPVPSGRDVRLRGPVLSDLPSASHRHLSIQCSTPRHAVECHAPAFHCGPEHVGRRHALDRLVRRTTSGEDRLNRVRLASGGAAIEKIRMAQKSPSAVIRRLR
jgi:hypothetical protein